MTDFPRRDFLKLASHALLAVSGLLGAGALVRFLSHPAQSPPQTEFDLGLAANYPLGSHTILPDVPAILSHTKSGFSALELVCTHLGCTVEQQMDEFTCPCHGSRFAANGTVQHGPAQAPLVSLHIEQTAQGHLILHRT